jgi:lysyl-tRNA synthetase class 2
MQISRTPVDSSVIAAIAYSADSALDVEFTSGVTYRYFAVPQTTAAALLSAESKGMFFNRFVRPRFSYQRLPSCGHP